MCPERPKYMACCIRQSASPMAVSRVGLPCGIPRQKRTIFRCRINLRWAAPLVVNAGIASTNGRHFPQSRHVFPLPSPTKGEGCLVPQSFSTCHTWLRWLLRHATETRPDTSLSLNPPGERVSSVAVLVCTTWCSVVVYRSALAKKAVSHLGSIASNLSVNPVRDKLPDYQNYACETGSRRRNLSRYRRWTENQGRLACASRPGWGTLAFDPAKFKGKQSRPAEQGVTGMDLCSTLASHISPHLLRQHSPCDHITRISGHRIVQTESKHRFNPGGIRARRLVLAAVQAAPAAVVLAFRPHAADSPSLAVIKP